MIVNVIICILLLIGIILAYLNIRTNRLRCSEEEIYYRNKLWTILMCNKELQVKNIFHPTPDSLFVDDAIVLLYNNLRQLRQLVNHKNRSQADKIIAMAQQVAKDKTSTFFTFKNTTTTGELKYFLCFIDYMNDNQIYIEIREDITHQQELQEERKKALLQLQTIYKTLPIGLELYDKEGKLIDCNKKILEIFGIKDKEAILTSNFTLKNAPFVSSILKDNTYPTEIISEQKNFDFCQIKNSPFIGIEKKGTIHLNIKIAPITDDSVALGYIAIIEDITPFFRTNKKLKNALQQVKQSDQLKSAFLANMSHEIRTPLNAIIGFSQLIMDTQDQEALREYMAIIEENNELLLKLINDILTLSRIEAGIKDTHKVIFDICQLCKDIAQAMTPFANKEVKIKTKLPEEKLMIYFDINYLNKVLYNIMTNAVKFTLHGEICISAKIKENNLYIYVEDTGIGIPKEQIPRVFERFEKLNSFAKGTGLGMAIAKAIIDSTGGKIGAESQQGIGSKFFISYPMDLLSPDLADENTPKTQPVNRDLFY